MEASTILAEWGFKTRLILTVATQGRTIWVSCKYDTEMSLGLLGYILEKEIQRIATIFWLDLSFACCYTWSQDNRLRSIAPTFGHSRPGSRCRHQHVFRIQRLWATWGIQAALNRIPNCSEDSNQPIKHQVTPWDTGTSEVMKFASFAWNWDRDWILAW